MSNLLKHLSHLDLMNKKNGRLAEYPKIHFSHLRDTLCTAWLVELFHHSISHLYAEFRALQTTEIGVSKLFLCSRSFKLPCLSLFDRDFSSMWTFFS